MEADLVRQVGIAVALAACTAPAQWSRDGLHVSGAPPVDDALVTWLEAYDDALGYRVLDFDEARGMLVESGGELELIARPGAKPEALSPYELDVDRAWFTAAGIEYTADTDGDERMQVYSLPRPAPATARGHVIAFSFGNAHHPRDAFTLDLDRLQLTAWTHARVSVPTVAPSDATIASFDGTPIHAYVYRPARVRGVVVELHGGPEDRFLPAWSPFEQALVARGYAVVQPNIRGSSGYGAAFAALDDGPHRLDALRDVGAVLDWARRIDPGDAVVLGTSYGGYLALSAAAAYRVRAVAALSPIPDLPDFLAHTARARADERRVEYGDERDPTTREFLARISPRPDAIHVPVLVAHGARDPRVPIPAVDRFVAAARVAGTTVWYARADDEGHTFSKTTNRLVVQALVLQLLEYHRSR